MIRREAWLFCRTSSGVRLCWELEEPKGPKGKRRKWHTERWGGWARAAEADAFRRVRWWVGERGGLWSAVFERESEREYT